MIPARIAFAALLVATAHPAAAIDLFTAQGGWTGTGSLATSVERRMQPARCQVDVKPTDAGGDVSVTGKCAVAVGASNISFRLVRGDGRAVRGAMWSEATDEILQLAGARTETGVDMTATEPWVVDGVDYETRVIVREPDAGSFKIQQLARMEGEKAWRVIVDMTYRQP
ncbi:MAG: hypothetical protein ACU0CY_01240 [Maritimibacter harenae]|jgi:hypothetical protein|uniref:DUF1579 domain-containing protein n=1 Tax=Maritimibacter harenae TaxID=2606218 RepID=A0A845LWS6_9RHOB|nr:hypothetical protein [Maritimibacter harenae]MZR12245.1 hypothetical protein [Maritimibacter harenae]